MSFQRPSGLLPGSQAETSALDELRQSARKIMIGVAVISAMINILYLTGSFFMLEVYDRVLPSRSMPTLTAICLLAASLYIFQGVLDFIRSRVFVRFGAYVDSILHQKVFQAIEFLTLRQRAVDPMQPSRDLDQIRAFMTNGGPAAFLDLPWLPLYVALCFAFHFWIGVTAVLAAMVLALMMRLTERGTAPVTRAAAIKAGERLALAESVHRNAEVLRALGMGDRMAVKWTKVNEEYVAQSNRASDVASGLGAISKVFRMAIQSAVLALGAFLVIRGEASGGVMIASSILVARALSPVELVIAHWRSFVSARQSWQQLLQVFQMLPDHQPMALMAPFQSLQTVNLHVVAPGTDKLLVSDVNFAVAAGSAVGVIGSSASGKSTLARALVGVWPAARGVVRLDGASITNWQPERLGRHIGYLPQNVELFSGTVAENIARFTANYSAEDVIAAASMAGVHDMILRLPNGYDTQIGEQGSLLSAGQRQRVALARALYGNPFLVVLDEPNSNLDAEGDEALNTAIVTVRQRGGIVVIIAHRPSAIKACDLLLVMQGGRCLMFDKAERVLAALAKPAQLAGQEAHGALRDERATGPGGSSDPQ